MQVRTHSSPAFASATGYLIWDHDRLLRLLAGIETSVEHGRLAGARRAYTRVHRRYLRHLRLEEEFVFPVFAARAGLLGGPTVVLRQEHEELRRALQLMEGALDALDADGFGVGLRHFREMMSGHRSKEERVLLPTMDALLSQAERKAFVERLRRE